MKNILFNSSKSILLIISYFTKIPIKTDLEYDDSDFKLGMIFLPIIGIIIGLGFVLIKILSFISSPYLVGLILTVFYVCITGANHIEGFSNTVGKHLSIKKEDEEKAYTKDESTAKTIGILILLISYVVLLGENTFAAVFLVPIVGKTAYMLSSFIIKDSEIEVDNKFLSVSDKSIRNSAFIFAFISSLIINYMAVIPLFTSFVLVGLVTKVMINKEEEFHKDNLGFVVELAQIVFLICAYYIL